MLRLPRQRFSQESFDHGPDFLGHVFVPFVCWMHTVRSDQIGPVDKPPISDWIDEGRTKFPRTRVQDIARLEDFRRRIGGHPGRADDQKVGGRCSDFDRAQRVAGGSR